MHPVPEAAFLSRVSRGMSKIRLFKTLPPHLYKMALYKVNSGCREQEVCNLLAPLETGPDLAPLLHRPHRPAHGELE
jgi:hypothetical protein